MVLTGSLMQATARHVLYTNPSSNTFQLQSVPHWPDVVLAKTKHHDPALVLSMSVLVPITDVGSSLHAVCFMPCLFMPHSDSNAGLKGFVRACGHACIPGPNKLIMASLRTKNSTPTNPLSSAQLGSFSL
jgi:hypothetical protein